VKINDRMSKTNKRLIDLSKSAAKELAFISRGLTKVKIELIED
jgi:rare lipoprotein A